MDRIEIREGSTLIWSSRSYDFPVAQKLAWSPDHRELRVELGRAMDDVFATSLRGAGRIGRAHRQPLDAGLELAAVMKRA